MSDTLSDSQTRYWTPDPDLVSRACQAAHGLVVDLCPGAYPLPYPGAVRVGWGHSDLDVTQDKLPFQDGEVDFLYCRHTLEDLLDPRWTLQEIARVAKSGWIEVPSILSEVARRVDGGSPQWRGYQHHRSLFWQDGGVLCFTAKYARLEYAELRGWPLAEALRNQSAWNTVHQWSGSLLWRQLRHEVDYHLAAGEYERLIQGVISSRLSVEHAWQG